MSRTSRRASRQLIIVVAVAIVLGVFITVHKLKSSHASENKSLATATNTPTPQPAAQTAVTPVAKVETPKAVTPPTTKPAEAKPANSFAAETEGLVTQTPTSLVKKNTTSASSNTPATGDFGPPSTQPSVSGSAVVTISASDGYFKTTGCEDWKKTG